MKTDEWEMQRMAKRTLVFWPKKVIVFYMNLIVSLPEIVVETNSRLEEAITKDQESR